MAPEICRRRQFKILSRLYEKNEDLVFHQNFQQADDSHEIHMKCQALFASQIEKYIYKFIDTVTDL